MGRRVSGDVLRDLGRPLSGIELIRKRIEEELADPFCNEDHGEELVRCAADVVYWVNTHVLTYDPRTPEKVLPFKLYPKQIEFLVWLGEREIVQSGGLCEKSRGVGVSFLCAAYALHGWLFKPGWKCGFGSRKLEYVDSIGDLNSLFEKMRFMLRHLPAWMLPVNFNWKKHDNHARLINPDGGSSITGEGGDQIGRGGRTSIYVVDEAAWLEHPQLAESSLVETTNVRIDVSTPNGPGNPFAIKRHGGKVSVFSFHWKDDPRKDDAWALKTKEEKGNIVFAIEYDLDYSASLEGICIPGAWVRCAVGLELVGHEVRRGKCIAGGDVGEEGSDLSVLIPRWGPMVGGPVSWGKCNTTQTAWRFRDLCNELGVSEFFYDSGGVGTGVKGTLNSSEKRLNFVPRPVNGGESPSEAVWPDGQTSQEKFLNLRAELWWCLRRRFERTFEYVTQGVSHKPEDLISLPNHGQLISELSMPLYERTERGKIKIESKESMRRRGIKSPDFADALAYSEAGYVLKKLTFWMR